MPRKTAKKSKWNTVQRVGFVLGAGVAAIVVFLIGGLIYISAQVPTIESLADYAPPQSTRVYSNDGFLVAYFAKERRTVVPIESLPRHVVEAFLAAEDEGFYEHQGLDYFGILRAAIKNLRPGAHLQGASTITQQTVKTLVLGPERSYLRKMREAILARQLEQMLTKDGILHLYLNQIYFGSGAYGIEQAAQTYFGKPARELDLGEAAYLASIPKSPAHYTIKADPAAAKKRQEYVLRQMIQNNWADPEAAEKEIAEPVPLPYPGHSFLNRAPHYVEHVRRRLLDELGETTTYEGGLTVYLGMNAKAQVAAQDALRAGLEDLARRHGWAGARVRIEVDRLKPYRAALHDELTQELERRAFLAKAHPEKKRERYVWDLSRLTNEKLATEEDARAALRVMPVEVGLRTTALVSEVNSVENTVEVDLGSCTGEITLASMRWARRFSPTAHTPPPRDPGDVLHVGDVVPVDIVDVPVRLASDQSPLTLAVELVPEPKAEGAVVSIDPHTRYVYAMVGGYEQSRGGLIRAVQSQRQPGSAFKPFVYATGLEQEKITPATICNDTQILIRDQWTGKAWKPANYDGRYEGPITYRTALMKSKNTCTVKLIDKVGPASVIQLAHAMGVESELPENLTLALGSGDVTPLELCNGYATIAAEGLRADPIFIRKIVGLDGRILSETQAEPQEVLRPATAYVLSQMMRSVVEEGTATRALVLDRPLAGKTGTSNESRNVWFAGFSRELVAVVWAGFDDNAPLGRAYGSNTALPVWIRYMGRALAGVPQRDFTPPDGVTFVHVDPETGQPSSGPEALEEAFIAGTEPEKSTQPLPSLFIEDDPRMLRKTAR